MSAFATSLVKISPRQFAAGLAVLFLLTFPDFFLLHQTFVYRDFGAFGYPLAFQVQESWREGVIPLWNPYNNCGLPFLAQWNTMALYPPSLFYVVLPVEWSVGLFCILHLYFGGLGMFHLARRWTGHDLGAALAGVAFAFSGLAFNSLLWPNNAAALGWMPWFLLAIRRAGLDGGRWLPAASLIGAMQTLAGAPEVLLQTWLLAPLFCLGRLVGDPPSSSAHEPFSVPERPLTPARPPGGGEGVGTAGEGKAQEFYAPTLVKRCCRIAVTAFLVLGLTAAQLLPFLQLLGTSHRTTGYADGVWPMPPWGWGNFLVPLFRCYSWQSGVFYQPDQFWTSSYYLGAFLFLLVIVAAGRARQHAVRVLAIAALAALVLALGKVGLLYPLLAKLPVMGLMRFPVKFVVAATLLLPLLAAFGLRWFEEKSCSQPAKTKRDLLIMGGAGLLAMSGLLAVMRLHPLPYDEFPASLRNAIERGALLIVMVAMAWGYLFARQTKWRPWIAGFLAVALWLDLSTHAPNLVLPVRPEILRANLARGDQPNITPGQGRVLLTRDAKQHFAQTVLTNAASDFLGKRLAGFANCNLLDHLPKVDGFYSLYPAWHYDLLTAIYNNPTGCPLALADLLSVSHQSASSNYLAWTARTSCLPLITAGQRPEFLNPTAIKQRVTTGQFDPRTAVLLDEAIQSRVKAKAGAKTTIEVARFGEQEITFRVISDAPAWVVVSQTHYPTWKAWVNRSPAPIVRANHAFQALEVPAGISEVRLACVDRGFQLGAAISALSWIGCLVWLRWPGRRAIS